jgi:chromate transporter
MSALYWQLVSVFSSLSVLGFGGGKGIIPQLHQDAVMKYQWVTSAQFTEFYTIGKLVPGPTTIMAALIGYAAGGPVAAAVATAAMFVPAALVMYTATVWWRKLPQSAMKSAVVGGLAPVIVGLMWSSVLSVGKGVPQTIPAFAIIGVVALLSLRTKLQAPALILGAGAAGLVLIR